MFALEVQYLMGRAYGGCFDNRQEPEWPPHPARLFAALAAAYHQAGLGEEVRQALCWLQNQKPPSISAGAAGPRRETRSEQDRRSRETPTSFVPHNYPLEQKREEVLPWIRLTKGKKERHFPSVYLERERAYFIWREAEPPESARAAFHRLLECVGYLGTSSSRVRVALCDQPPEPDWVPADEEVSESNTILCVPYPGRLKVLEDAHRAGRQAPPGRPIYYRPSGDGVVPPVSQSLFDELLVFRCVGRFLLPARYTLHYTSRLRDALIRIADELGLLFDALHGHNEGPHCAFLALPHTGHPHAEGVIKGFGLALPRALSPQRRRELRQIAERLSVLNFGHWGACRVQVLGEEAPMGTLDPDTWMQPSSVWTTVTPMLLDRFPKDKPGRTLPEIVEESCYRVDLPRPVTVEFGAYSSEPGVPPVPGFVLQRRTGEQRRIALHVTLGFAQRVRGPVLLGAGRFFGLGLCKPLVSAEALP